MGPFGVRQILESLPVGTKAVTIGGIKSSKIINVIQKSKVSKG
jgi:preprotein translocase subunit YajC